MAYPKYNNEWLFFISNQRNKNFSFDWTTPKEVLLLDAFYAKYGSRGNFDVNEVAALNFYQLIIAWAKHGIYTNILPFSIAVAGFITPPLVLLFFKMKHILINKSTVLLLGIYYLATIVWVINVPEYRFGLCIIQLMLLTSFLELKQFISVPPKWLWLVQILLPLFAVVHFSKDFFTRSTNSHFSIRENWFLPAIDQRYLLDKYNKASFPYIYLQNGIKLYLSDDNHECLNACLPCMSWRYGEIEMRGKTLQQGFRNLKNEVRKNYPWLPQ